ncbi:MAG: hypothetical protein HYT93_00670 [Parcubacteria group bacterium]|nr:hypothetical protein [Parcubacteria group bacterium]
MKTERGFTHIFIIGIVAVIVAAGLGSHFYFSTQSEREGPEEIINEPQSSARSMQNIEEAIPRADMPKSGQENVSETDLGKSKPATTLQKISFPSKPRTVAESDVVQGHPVNCYPRLGFDNYRTEQAFVVNPKNNKEMYINVEYKGLYKSVDGGNTWSFSGKGLKGLPRNDDPSKPCYELRFHLYIDPSNPQRLLAPGGSAPGKVGEGLGGLSESLDGGATWHQLFTSEMSAYTESAVMNPTDTNIVYVTTSALPQGMDGPDKGKTFVTKGIVYKTVDNGKTWKELSTGLFPDLRVPGIFIDVRDPKRLRLATFGLPSGTNVDKKSTDEQWGFLETNDAGESWTKLGATLDLGIRHLDVSAVDLNRFYIMASKDNMDKIYYSIDGSLLEPDNMMVNFARYNPHDETGTKLIGVNLYAQPNDIFESTNGGRTWNAVGKLPNGITNDHRVANIVFDPIDPNVIYINSDLARIWKSSDKGKTWNMLLSLDKLQ